MNQKISDTVTYLINKSYLSSQDSNTFVANDWLMATQHRTEQTDKGLLFICHTTEKIGKTTKTNFVYLSPFPNKFWPLATIQSMSVYNSHMNGIIGFFAQNERWIFQGFLSTKTNLNQITHSALSKWMGYRVSECV